MRLELEQASYPREILGDLDSALVLFCSAFGGANDASWVRDAWIRHVTAVDKNAETLA